MYTPQENFHGFGWLPATLFPQLGVGARQQYGYSAVEGMMQQQAQANADENARMNAIMLHAPRPKETCAACSKIKRLPYKRGEQLYKLPVCVDCYEENRPRLWHVLYGLGLA
jgi:hypothetical protein